MDPASTWIGVVAASISAAAAIAAWRAAAAANKVARELALIESARRHRELTPEIRATIAAEGGTFRVTVHLDGPLDLRTLDRVTVAVRNDTIDHTPMFVSNVTIDDANEHIWGPLRFTPGVDGAQGNGRRVGPVRLKVGDDHPFQMELSTPPSWSGPDGRIWWQSTYQRGGIPVRLAVTCEKDEETPWEIPLELHPSSYEFGDIHV